MEGWWFWVCFLPVSSRRHFCIFNCPLPSDTSMDKIFGTIGLGHYSAKRGFSEPVRDLVERLVPLTRHLWMATKVAFLFFFLFQFVSPNPTRLYWVLLSFTGLNKVLPCFTVFYWVLPDFNGLYWVLLDLTGFHRVFIGLNWVWPCLTVFYWVITVFCFVVESTNSVYLVLPGFTGFYLVLSSFHQVLPVFIRFSSGFSGFYRNRMFFFSFT